jgi:hypothetical protein
LPNRNKEKGDRGERAALKAALDSGHDAKRTRAGYERDAGDLHLFTPSGKVVAQVKDCKAYSWPAWFEQLDAQIAEAEAVTGFLWVKRPGMGDAGEWLAVMPAKHMLKLLNRPA